MVDLMKTVSVQCPAKINLTFDIVGKRSDGYHDIETLFQSISLEDQLTFSIVEATELDLELSCENPYVKRAMPLDSTNLISRAVLKFFQFTGMNDNWKIHIDIQKHIPIAAGLAGGSSNAAGTLVALNELFQTGLSIEQLCDVGTSIGADVPFCIRGGTAIGRGKGEILTPVTPALEMTYCIVKPRKLSVSTQHAYSAFHAFAGTVKKPSLTDAVGGLVSGDMEVALSGFGNVFEPMIFAEYPQLAELKGRLLDLGTWDCHMSGSGPTLFAVVPSREMAHHLRRTLLNDDDLGFFYGTDEVFSEGKPPLDIRIAENCSHGARTLPVKV